MFQLRLETDATRTYLPIIGAGIDLRDKHPRRKLYNHVATRLSPKVESLALRGRFNSTTERFAQGVAVSKDRLVLIFCFLQGRHGYWR